MSIPERIFKAIGNSQLGAEFVVHFKDGHSAPARGVIANEKVMSDTLSRQQKNGVGLPAHELLVKFYGLAGVERVVYQDTEYMPHFVNSNRGVDMYRLVRADTVGNSEGEWR